jgi:Fur family peroxide stress response transcriptional regulator
MNYSRQREAIISFLKMRKDHPTADVIYQNVRKQYPKISLATVYRNLSVLTEHGDILRIQVGDGMDHYDYDTSPHNHFVCRSCGAVSDLPTLPDDTLDSAASACFDGIVQGHVTYFYGICKDCCR